MTAGLFAHLADQVPLDAQIEELKRERAMRDAVYTRWIQQGRMKPSMALRRNARLEAAIATLEKLKAGVR